MSQRFDPEAIAQEIELNAIKEGRALADNMAENFSDRLVEIDFGQNLMADYIFESTAIDLLARFPRLVDADKPKLQNRAKMAVESAFKMRLAN